jgi:adenylate kinase family enzyme
MTKTTVSQTTPNDAMRIPPPRMKAMTRQPTVGKKIIANRLSDNRAVDLNSFGDRICILGPSSSGKSTLAVAIGRSTGLPVIHLDQYRHAPESHWEPRTDEEFAALHDQAVNTDRWIIEGNYSKLMASRFERASGFILLDSSAGTSLIRYLKRTTSNSERYGGIDGVRDRLSWSMIRWILSRDPREGRGQYRARFDDSTMPKAFLRSRGELNAFYEAFGLKR